MWNYRIVRVISFAIKFCKKLAWTKWKRFQKCTFFYFLSEYCGLIYRFTKILILFHNRLNLHFWRSTILHSLFGILLGSLNESKTKHTSPTTASWFRHKISRKRKVKSFRVYQTPPPLHPGTNNSHLKSDFAFSPAPTLISVLLLSWQTIFLSTPCMLTHRENVVQDGRRVRWDGGGGGMRSVGWGRQPNRKRNDAW